MNKQKKNILLVDDDPLLRKIAKNIIQGAGYQYLESETGSEGFNLAIKNIPDLIILDIHLPDMTGIDFLQKLGKDQEIKHIPVIMLSADNKKNVVKEAIALGASDYVIKPIINTLFLQKIRKQILKQENLSYTYTSPFIIEASLNASITQLSEAELAISAPVKFSPKTDIKVSSSFFEKMDLSNVQFKTLSTPNTYLGNALFLNSIKMIGLTEDNTNNIRRKITGWNI